MDGEVGFANVLDRCLAVREGEQVVLLTDEGTDAAVVEGSSRGSRHRRGVPVVSTMPVPALPGAEPPERRGGPDARGRRRDRAHEPVHRLERRPPAATAVGVRYLAMPGVRLETFRDDGPLAVDFDAIRGDAERIGDAWAAASSYRLTTPGGTDLRGSVEGRPGRVLHGLAREDGAYMAPPDIEAGTAPVESSSSGIVVVDADLLFMGEGRFRRRWCSTSPTARWSGWRAPKRAGWKRCSPAATTTGWRTWPRSRWRSTLRAACAAWRWRPSRRSGPHTSRSATRSRTAVPSMRSRTWTA